MASVSKIALGNLREGAKAADSESSSKHAVAEINTYIAIRDSLLVEAEEVMMRARLDRLTNANEFVETCLRPPRSPSSRNRLKPSLRLYKE